MALGAGFPATVFSIPTPSLFQKSKGYQEPDQGEIMHPMLIVAIPLVLVIAGMVLNSIGLSFDQPPSSSEQDPAKRAAAEAEETVLSLTLKDGSNVKYLIKAPTADALEAAKKDGISKQKVSSYDMG